MKKKLLLSGFALLIIIILSAYLVNKPSEKDTPPPISAMNLTRLPVQFSHTAMKEVECVTCHHLVNGEENYLKCSSKNCHDVLGSNARREVSSYYRITHEPKTEQYYSCIKCHLEVAALKPELKHGLTACTDSFCHSSSPLS